MTRPSRLLIGAFGATFTISLLAGCSPTTYDATYDTTADTTYDTTAASEPTGAATTTLPAGTDAELLARMLAEVQALPQRVADSDGDGAAATRIEQLWAAVEPSVEATQPELIADFEFVVRRCRAAADRNRPADADRAFKNLDALVAAYLG